MTNQDHVFYILDDVLLLLSGQGFPTPEKTYKLDGGWRLALSDLRRCFENYRTRIAELEAERDTIRKLRKLFDDKEEDWIADRQWLQALNRQLINNSDAMQAERDADRAGEARAVEALKVAYEAAEDWHGSVEWEGREYTQAVLDACDAVLADSQPALDWLAQREREAVVAELRDWAERWWDSHSDFSAGDFTQRIAALKNQQPTACSRSEVRGEENNNA
jgi:hypothetical protein